MSEDKLPNVGAVDPGGDPGGVDEDPLRRAAREIRAAGSLQALVPLSAAEREQLADAAIALAGAPARSSEPAGDLPPVTPLRRPRPGTRVVAAVVAASFAFAAAVALYLHHGRPAVRPLAAFAMVVEGEQTTRGSAEPTTLGEPVELRPKTRLVVTLTTQTPERDARLRLVLVRDGRATLLDPPITWGKAGATIEGAAAELLGAQSDGPAELVVVLGRELPAEEDIRALALRPAGDVPRHLQVRRWAVRLEGFSHAAVDVLLGGCSAVVQAPGGPGPPRCELTGVRIHLWVGVPATAAVAIYVDGHVLGQKPEARGGGSAFDLDVPARTGSFSVRLEDREIAAWAVAPAAIFEKVRAAEAARRAGKLDEADAALEGIPADASAEEQLEAVRWRAKIALRRGKLGQERGRREQAVELARSLGHVSAEADETLAIIYSFRREHALAQAVQLLPALDAPGLLYGEGAVHRDLIRGLLASELGELGAALGSFQRALATAERIGDAADRARILAPQADVLQALGRSGESLDAIDAAIQRGETDADVCARVDALTSAGWLLRDLDPRRAQPLVDLAAQLAAQRCPHKLPIALVNQGWLFAAAGRFGEARAVLDQISLAKQAPDARVTTWLLRLEAETVLGEDPARAEQHAQHLAASAATLCSTELAYEAHLLRARALVLLDRPGPAAAAFAEAERALTLWSRLVPLGEGRATFFQRHDQLALTAIPFFLAQARRGDQGARLALAATVRRSIARFVTSLAGGDRARARAERGETGQDPTPQQFDQTTDRWPTSRGAGRVGEVVPGVCQARDTAMLAGEEPALTGPPAQPALFVHPTPLGLLVLAWRGSSIDFRELPGAAAGERPDALSDRIAEAAAPMLAGAPRVHVHVHRSLARLPIDRSLGRSLDRSLGRSLGAQRGVPIAFAVDAPAPAPGACAGPQRALLVANPQRNLWAASSAVPVIQPDLERLGFVVDTLDGAAATRAAIEARLADPCTALFHYDGHAGAALRAAGGATGPHIGDRIDDALLLASGDTLTAADVLKLPRVPESVVLNGCTTAAPEGLGLAQAFLLAGAAQVVASLDELPADAAASFTRKLFEGATSSPASLDLVRLFARAMAGADVPALRVFER
jgi:tetratricopeptide (TPR) repeat protein